ncbi:DUF3307 domain-containing protein [Mahella australiensis]|uniref:DUF3307 domain-containing protein n=1 Tax=Mahella australiensis (strain DSM 15567 / CIP 107919 / 50-1 BON) TaxID=697281 RepID=F3ZVN4_MAHA5|nr:DUF3307 domain-containing protein [Mahella australiensis]AEE97428.1 hypothetical protein Mahau_2259 [Mahella australiensis 50-1 BON]
MISQTSRLVLALLLLSHGFADFVAQTDKMVTDKTYGYRAAYVKHFFANFITSFVLMLPFMSLYVLTILLLLSLMHIFIDFMGYRRQHAINNVPGFFIDQACHIFLIIIAWLVMRYSVAMPFSNAYINTDILSRYGDIACIAVVYLYVIFGGAVFMKKIMRHPLIKISQQEVAGVGRYIGMLERAIIMTLVLFDAMTAMAFVLTAKSLARYKELDDKAFAEYYLMGTLASTLIALAGGLLARLWL